MTPTDIPPLHYPPTAATLTRLLLLLTEEIPHPKARAKAKPKPRTKTTTKPKAKTTKKPRGDNNTTQQSLDIPHPGV